MMSFALSWTEFTRLKYLIFKESSGVYNLKLSRQKGGGAEGRRDRRAQERRGREAEKVQLV